MGESFGYGIAEPMNLGKPVVTNSTPCLDQAQIELVRHGETGFVIGTSWTLSDAILTLAGKPEVRDSLGRSARRHIRELAEPEKSLDRIEMALNCSINGTDNPNAESDFLCALEASTYLDFNQYGHSLSDQLMLRAVTLEMKFRRSKLLRRFAGVWREVIGGTRGNCIL
jgi:hypothetical protein